MKSNHSLIMNLSANGINYTHNITSETPSESYKEVFLFLKAFDTSLVILTNSLTMVILYKYAKLETPSNIFTAWLTLSDLLFASALPFNIGSMYLPTGHPWTLCCFFQIYIAAASSLCNCVALFAIGLDSLLYIVYSLTYHSIVTVRRAWTIVTSVTLTCLLYTLLCVFFGYTDTASEGYLVGSCIYYFSLSRTAGRILGIPFVIVTPVTVGCYIKIGLVALKQSRTIATAPMSQAAPSNMHQFKIAKVMLNVLVVYIGCNVLFAVHPLIVGLLRGVQREVVFSVFFFLWRVNKWVNPIIYVWKSPRFRIHVQNFSKNHCFVNNT